MQEKLNQRAELTNRWAKGMDIAFPYYPFNESPIHEFNIFEWEERRKELIACKECRKKKSIYLSGLCEDCNSDKRAEFIRKSQEVYKSRR